MSLWQRAYGWLTRAGRLEVAVLLAIFLAVVGLWIFGVLAEEVMEGDTAKFDQRLLLACRQPGNLAIPIGPAWSLQVARDLTAFGGAAGLMLITAIIAGQLCLEKRYGLLTFILASVGSGTVLALILKAAFQRPRPGIVPHLTDIATDSFPSGHSMLSSVVYLTLAALLARAAPNLRLKFYYLTVAMLLVGLIGCSRVYLGVHYPTDVLAGWSLGCTWAVTCCLAAHLISTRSSAKAAHELSAVAETPRGDSDG